MRNYFVVEIKEGAEVKLEIVDESFYYTSFKDKLQGEGKKVRIISSFEYYL